MKPLTPSPSRRRRRATGLLVAATAALLSACATHADRAPATALNIDHASGRTTVAAKPQKSVVLDLAALDTLHALGVDTVVAVPAAPLPAFLDAYADETRYPRVGTLFEPDAAAIRALAPDLIIVGGRSAGKRGALQPIAPTIDLSAKPGDLVQAVTANVRLLATLYEKEDVAQPLLQRLAASSQAVRQRTRGQTGLVVLTTGGKIMAIPPGPRFGAIYETFGITPLALEVEAGARGKQISPDFIRQHDPDWLLVIDRDAAIGRAETPARELLDEQPGLRQTKVSKTNRIVHLDPVHWYILGAGGIMSLQQSVDQIAAALDK